MNEEQGEPISEYSHEDQKKNSPTNPFLIPGAIMVAGVLIALAVVYSSRMGAVPSQYGAVGGTGETPSEAVDLKDIAGDDPSLGDPGAPITMVEFSDFQCPFCAQFFSTTEQEIIEKYVKTGKVKFVYRDFALSAIHDMAQKAAEAGECAHEQNQFWKYHDFVFGHQKDLSLVNLKRWAGEVGLDQARFNVCLDSGKYQKEVEEDFAYGRKAGVSGTPTSFINGKKVEGSRPFEDFKVVIEGILNGEKK